MTKDISERISDCAAELFWGHRGLKYFWVHNYSDKNPADLKI